MREKYSLKRKTYKQLLEIHRKKQGNLGNYRKI